MINDRGTIKWTSIMMPEQIEALQKMWEAQEYKEKPILDEQQLQENEFKLRGSLKAKVEVKITYFADHDFHEIKGMINGIKNNTIYIEGTEINFYDIIDVDFVHSIFDPY